MKKLLVVAITLLTIQTAFSQVIAIDDYQKKNTTKAYNLLGNVKQISSSVTDANGQSTTLPFLENEFYNRIDLHFNTNGNLTKRINYLDYKGKLGIYSFVDLEYNTSQELIIEKTTTINNHEDPLRISSLKENSYDRNGNLILIKETVKSKNSTSNYQTEFLYQPKLSQIITKIDGSVTSSDALTYNKNGQVNKVENTSFDGKKGLKTYFIYDENTLIYKEENINNRKKIQFYNLEDKFSKLQQFDHNQELKLELNFDADKNVSEAKIQTFLNGKPVLKSYQIKYTYDAKNNWTKANVYHKNDLHYIITREIMYF